MSFSEKLTEIMQKRNITAQDISKQSNISVQRVRTFQNGTSLPNQYQISVLNKIFGLDFELFLNESKAVLEPVKSANTKADFKISDKISKAEKSKKPREVNILIPPKEKQCRWCDIETGTECYRHAEDDIIKYLSGGGIMGSKISDQFTVWGCQECDSRCSIKPDKENHIKQIEHSLKWSIGIIKTWLM